LKFVFFLDVLKCLLCPLEESECYVMWLCVIVNTTPPSYIRHEWSHYSTEGEDTNLKLQPGSSKK